MANKPSARKNKDVEKTVVECTDANQRVRGQIVSKSNTQLVVDLPTGYQMTLSKSENRKLYVYRVGTLEFVSDGWPIN